VSRTFFVERYWPDVTREALAAALHRALAAEQDMAREGREVRHIRTTLVPEDEAVFSLFEAVSAEDVAELNKRAAIPFDRIVEAVSLIPEIPNE